MQYSEIVAAGKAYADRNKDPEIIANIDIFLRFGEARLSRLLKVRKASVRAQLAMGTDEYYSLPPDFGGMRDIQVISPPEVTPSRSRTLYYSSPEQMNAQSQLSSGISLNIGYYTVIADQIQIWPVGAAGDTLELIYYRRIPPLIPDVPQNVNWVSDDHPDIYLSLLMYEISLFIKNHEVALSWTNRLNTALDELDVTDKQERWSGTPMATRPDSLQTYPERRAG
jgi:hypothetical protein